MIIQTGFYRQGNYRAYRERTMMESEESRHWPVSSHLCEMAISLSLENMQLVMIIHYVL